MEFITAGKLTDSQALKIARRHELVTNFLRSHERDLILEQGFQRFLDGNSETSALEALPKAPAWRELCAYLKGAPIRLPLVATPQKQIASRFLATQKFLLVQFA